MATAYEAKCRSPVWARSTLAARLYVVAIVAQRRPFLSARSRSGPGAGGMLVAITKQDCSVPSHWSTAFDRGREGAGGAPVATSASLLLLSLSGATPRRWSDAAFADSDPEVRSRPVRGAVVPGP